MKISTNKNEMFKELKLILEKSNFNVKTDYLWIAGDLVSRGQYSLQVIRYLYSIRDRTKIVLGNHDLNLIAVYSGIQINKKENYLKEKIRIFGKKEIKDKYEREIFACSHIFTQL